MLSSIVKEHQAKQAVKREDLEKKRKVAVVAASNLTSALVDHLNVGVAQAYLNQKRLDHESKELHVNVTNFAKQTAQWLQLVENFSQVLKEIGDVENWAKSIENDMQTVSSALEYAYKEITLKGFKEAFPKLEFLKEHLNPDISGSIQVHQGVN